MPFYVRSAYGRCSQGMCTVRKSSEVSRRRSCSRGVVVVGSLIDSQILRWQERVDCVKS